MAGAPEFLTPLDPCNISVRRCRSSRERASRRILIVRLSSFGDVLMGSPLAAALRAAYPDAWLTWMVEHAHREAVQANPHLDELIVWDGSYFKTPLKRGRGVTWLGRALRMRAQLRRRRFDTFITFHGEHWPTLTWGVGADTRIGVFDVFPQFNPPRPEYRRHYTTSFAAPDLPPHRTDIHLLPLRPLGLPEPSDKQMSFGYTVQDAAVVDDFLTSRGVPRRFIVFAPRTTWETRNWPLASYARLADRLARREGCHIILVGTAQDRGELAQIEAAAETAPTLAAGVFTFRQLAALTARAALLVSGDTGPMHAAAAVGTPYVALFGPTPVAGRAPLSGRGVTLMHPVPCGPCDQEFCPMAGGAHMRCMTLISVEEVVEAACRVMNAPAVPSVI